MLINLLLQEVISFFPSFFGFLCVCVCVLGLSSYRHILSRFDSSVCVCTWIEFSVLGLLFMVKVVFHYVFID